MIPSVSILVLLSTVITRSGVDSFSAVNSNTSHSVARRAFFQNSFSLASFWGFLKRSPAEAETETIFNSGLSARHNGESLLTGSKVSEVAYRTISLPISDFGVEVPVAFWYPVHEKPIQSFEKSEVRYQHRISVKRIGELLAGWDFIPEFASRNFAFYPLASSPKFVTGEAIPFPVAANVVFLAHGYLGSRFDLSHIAEELAGQGFVCISPEYPESLAASYPRIIGLDRSVVNDALLTFVEENLKPRSYAGIGHSLGCGTVLRMGDASWTRVLIAGRAPETVSSSLLFISSINDGAVKFGGPLAVPAGYELLQEDNLPSNLPTRAALIFDRPDAPNHISYLSANVNDAMVSFLSPLLPLAQAMSIPVLDFDRYQKSQDSVQTGAILTPVISSFLNQQMSNRLGSY